MLYLGMLETMMHKEIENFSGFFVGDCVLKRNYQRIAKSMSCCKKDNDDMTWHVSFSRIGH